MDTLNPQNPQQDQQIEVSKAADNISARFQSTNKTVTEELSLKEIVKIFTGNWLLFLILFSVVASTAGGIYVLRIPFVSSGSLVANDAQNSALQSFTTQFFGLTKSVADGKKNNSPLQKHLEFLKTEEFFNQFMADLEKRGSSTDLSIAEKNGYQIYKQLIAPESNTIDDKNKSIQKLDAMAKIKLQSDFEIAVAFQASDKELALFLTNTALTTIVQSLKDRESLEIIKVESFIKNQIDSAVKNMALLNTQLAEFQNKSENLITLSSKEKVSEYLSELMVRKNEVRLKIAENEKAIGFLSAGPSKRRESQLYGNGGRVQSLRLENEMYQSKLKDIQKAIDQVAQQAKSIPVASQVFDDLKKKSEIEFSKYKSLTEAFSKVEAQKLSVQNRFEILEKSRIEKVVPQISLLILMMLALIISQILGSLIIYIIYIWDSNAVLAQSSRDIVIIDSHSLDPRVIIENTKIKFRLKHTHFSEDSETENESKKLTFKIFNKKSASGEKFDS